MQSTPTATCNLPATHPQADGAGTAQARGFGCCGLCGCCWHGGRCGRCGDRGCYMGCRCCGQSGIVGGAFVADVAGATAVEGVNSLV
eukprot:740743-Alexandrium_andersonii.AAC.1